MMDQINGNDFQTDFPKNVTLCEDYAVKTHEEVEQILKNCADIYIRHWKKKHSIENI